MRKQKAYFGQRAVKHYLGRNAANKWVVPRVMHNWFQCRQACHIAEHQLKIMNNSAWGKGASKLNEGYHKNAVIQRRELKQGVLGHLTCKQMDALLNGEVPNE